MTDYLREARRNREVVEQVRYAVNWIIGGYENMIADGQMSHDELPTFSELVDEVFNSLHCCHYGEGYEANGALTSVITQNSNHLRGLIAYEMINTNFII